MFYRQEKGNRVLCLLCPHGCSIKPGNAGICGVRRNEGGILTASTWGKAAAMHIDPVEKKPLFHFYPGSRSFSVAAVACNFKCVFCQNASISQGDWSSIPGQTIRPLEIAGQASQSRCLSISYTYTEPTIYFEFAMDTMKEARKYGLRNILITNGYINREPLAALIPYLDAANIDLKFFNDRSYKKYTGGSLQPVLDSIEFLKSAGKWVEITTLIIPGLNDSDKELGQIASFIAELDSQLPWHISRFFPHYRMKDRPPTPSSTIARARRIGENAGLSFIYSGNLPGDPGENTYCADCGSLLIERTGFTIYSNLVAEGKCSFCGGKIAGVGFTATL